MSDPLVSYAVSCFSAYVPFSFLMVHSAPEGGKDKYMAGGAFAKERGCGTVVHVNKNLSFSQR